jgi:hypothetical protein
VLIEVSHTHNRLIEERHSEFLKLSFIVETSPESETTKFESWTGHIELSENRLEQIASGVFSALHDRPNNISKVVLTECEFMDVTPDQFFKSVAHRCLLEALERTGGADLGTQFDP